jgi:oligopeptide/dipeptide ABC transporter ATP-binding protein
MVPALTNMPSGCPFHPRCQRKMDICSKKTPGLFVPASGRQVACWLYGV